MVSQIVKAKEEYCKSLNKEAWKIAKKLEDLRPVTKKVLKTTAEIYAAARSEKRLFEKNKTEFECAYHESASSDLEFLLARILYNYSKIRNLNWKILLRKQSKRNGKQIVPDIEIKNGSKTLAIIEIKIKASWIQYLFSKVRKKHDRKKYKDKKAKLNPTEERRKQRERIRKFGIDEKRIFFILPSLCGVYKRKHSILPKDYRSHFCEELRIPKKNLVIMSSNPKLNLDEEKPIKKFEPTKELERMIQKIVRLRN